MKVAILNTYTVADITELKALTPSTDDMKYVISEVCVYYFNANIGSGDVTPDVGEGFWYKDYNVSLYYAVPDNYDFAGNSATEITNTTIVNRVKAQQPITNNNYNIDFAIYPFLRDSHKNDQINEVDYGSVKFLTINTQRRDTFNKGQLIKVEYFETYNKTTNIGTNKILQVDIVYIVGADSLVSSRTTTRKWYLRDNTTIGVSIDSIKTYTNEAGITEGITRRDNNVNNLKLMVPGMIMATTGDSLIVARDKGRTFFSELSNDFTDYIAVDNRAILTDIPAVDHNVHTWLNNPIGPGVTIELYILDQLDY